MKGPRFHRNLNDKDIIDCPEPSDVTDELLTREPYKKGNIAVFFDDLQARLIEQIQHAEAVVGCVAWLQHELILHALSKLWSVSLLIQKEDFLRPDLGPKHANWKEKYRRAYVQLPSRMARYELGDLIPRLSYTCGSSEYVDPVRCVGFSGDERTRPRMHHKFIVFCHVEEASPSAFDFAAEVPYGKHHHRLLPYAVWTGSFNFTNNATQSLENAILIEDDEIAMRFYREYEYVFALSEPLDWESEYCEPEYRIGT